MTATAPTDALLGYGGEPQVGLCGPDANEISESWYERKPWAFTVTWTKPLDADPRVTRIGGVLVFDSNNVEYLSGNHDLEMHSGDSLEFTMPLPRWMD